MRFLETVRRARSHLEEQGRVSLRALKRDFELDDDALDELVEELVGVQRVAVREGQVLVWVGPTRLDPPITESSRMERLPGDVGNLRLPYTPKHLADKILLSKSAIEGERKQVTVLFADVKGSTQLAEQAGPEQWHEILDGYLRILAAGVHRFEGTVNQYTGDGIMALFGAPIAHEDHAQRACYAALWLRDELHRYALRLRREQGLDFQTRIGLNSGEVVVGKIGDDLRMDYTAQGQTVHLAKRMEQLAEAGQLYLAPATAALVEGFFVLDDLGEFQIKGVAEMQRLHALTGVGQAHTRLEVARLRGLTRFVGRVHEMESLEAALAQAREGRGQIVGVVGEAGVGKSRLCAQFIDGTRAAGTPVYPAHCVSHGKTVSFLPMLELLRALLGVAVGETTHEQRRKIAGELILLDKSFEDVLPLVLDFLGVADPEQPAHRMDADACQRQLFHFVRRLVRARSTRESVVLFLDDVHWIDAGSDGFLAQVVEAVTDTRALLLVNFRPEYHADWMDKSEYQQLPLRRLAAEEIEAMQGELVGDDASTRGLRNLIRERTSGNPFFIEEVVRSLAESGVLAGTRGAYKMTGPIEAPEVPTTVQPVLAARIDRLGEREKQALQAASVIGREFSEPILKAVLDWPDADLSEAFAALKNGEFVYERSLYPVTEYAFRHPLTQEVALGSQLRERRARTHAAVARALEAAYPDRLDEQAALLAHHYEAADEALKAAQCHRRAAIWLVARDWQANKRHWRQVHELARSLSPTPESDELVLGACIQLISTSLDSSLSDEERDRFAAEGRALAERTGNRVALLLLDISLAVARNLCGGTRESPIVPARRAVAIATELNLEARMMAHQVLGNALWFSESVVDALHETEEAVELARNVDLEFGVGFQGFSIKNFGLVQRAGQLLWTGRPREAEVDYARTLEVALERHEFTPSCQIYLWSGPWLEELTGNPHQALERAQKAVQWAEREGNNFNQTSAIHHLGLAQLRAGQFADALDSLRHVDHMQRVLGVAAQSLNHAQGLLAEAYLAAGDAKSARAAAQRCEDEFGAPPYDLWGHVFRARVLRALDGAKARVEIEASLSRAEKLLERCEAWAFGPFIIEERARLAEVLGDAEGAAHLLREARRAFAEVEATGHAERLERELER
ncbi:MAG: AAA family ATPase [Deltaproteobacteria bacterium]|nr:AAA family ATPase [Deltaproteobacteria bacterium]MBW2388312.1 AAA family ATPase [Deltaproteobacteria bacterium]